MMVHKSFLAQSTIGVSVSVAKRVKNDELSLLIFVHCVVGALENPMAISLYLNELGVLPPQYLLKDA